MIDEFSTFLCFKYYSDELTYGSNKKVWTVCDKCGKYRLLSFKKYNDLCRSCAGKNKKYLKEPKFKRGKNHPMFGKHHTKETCDKISKSNTGKMGPNNGRKFSTEVRKKMSESAKIKHFSEEHRKNISKANSGKNSHYYGVRKFGSENPNWNSNLTNEDREFGRITPGYKEWRKSVYERDNYTCQICRQISNKLNAHHIEGYAKNPDLRTTLSNGITFCKTCHGNFHHRYGKGNNTRKQFIEFMGSN